MLIATLHKPDGRKVLVLGLDEENMQRLRDDKPIYKDLSKDVPIAGLENWDLSVLGPEDLARFIARFKED